MFLWYFNFVLGKTETQNCNSLEFQLGLECSIFAINCLELILRHHKCRGFQTMQI